MNLNYLSYLPGIDGVLKEHPEDFIVEEITTDGSILSIDKPIIRGDEGKGPFLKFVLQKKGWTTEKALREIARKMSVSPKRFNFSGNKDRQAITTQLCSGFKITKEKLSSIALPDIKINGMWYSDERIHLGELLGNHFIIKVRNCKYPQRAKEIAKSLNGFFPNYFGEQRFGSTRKNTFKIGLYLLRGEFEDGILSFLTDIEGEKNPLSIEARNRLKEEGNYREALKYFPKHLHLERSILYYLKDHPTDMAGAFRRLPRSILLLFIHSVQAYIFNAELSIRLHDLKQEKNEKFCGRNFYGFPDIHKSGKDFLCLNLVGYDTELNEYEKEILGDLGINTNDFRMKSIPEINSKGSIRPALAPIKDLKINDTIFSFSIPKGSYATILMREFIDDKRRISND